MKKSFRIEFSSFLTKKEREILKKTIDFHINKKENIFYIQDLGIPKIKNDELNFFERFCKKGIWLLENNSKIYLNYFSYFQIKNEQIKFFLNENFIKYFEDKKLKKDYSLYDIIFLKHFISSQFLFEYLINYLNEDSFIVTINELKRVLQVENYSRMYDLDRYVFQTIIDDINENTQFNIKYEKIKTSNKVEEIKFYIENKNFIQLKTNIKMLLFLYKKYIKNEKKFTALIEHTLKYEDYSFLKEKIIYAIKIAPKFNFDFESALEFILKKGLQEEYLLLIKTEYLVKNKFDFQKKVFKDIQNYVEDKDVFTQSFSDKLVKEMYKQAEDTAIEVFTENTRFKISYSSINKSSLSIYIKKHIYRK